MNLVLGIDIGGSTTKVVALKDGKPVGMKQVRAGDQVTSLYGAIGHILRTIGIGLDEVKTFAVTGVGASFVDEQIYGVDTRKVNEFTAIGCGALHLSGLSEALVVSMGTGTAFVRAGKDEAERVGGSGIGGGTIIGLASQMLAKSDIDAIIALAEKGNLENVDLMVRDIVGHEIPALSSSLTAANFGKIKSTASDADIALGIMNMVFQTIGMLAVFVIKNDPIKNVVLTGTLATFPHAAPILLPFSNLADAEFTIPPNAVFATALGAALIGD
ncbi:MAG: pantothenate kinase [Oscillospiraceae bacterium]|nr:pantothenate kinase [Oscillospiraceae bacterium]